MRPGELGRKLQASRRENLVVVLLDLARPLCGPAGMQITANSRRMAADNQPPPHECRRSSGSLAARRGVSCRRMLMLLLLLLLLSLLFVPWRRWK